MLRPALALDVLRDDVVRPGIGAAALEALAPAWRDGRLQVPRTVDQDG
jgi:Asp-tRNA(Asn)/Glu-tRNA(Gln) amidotransferase C subunit